MPLGLSLMNRKKDLLHNFCLVFPQYAALAYLIFAECHCEILSLGLHACPHMNRIEYNSFIELTMKSQSDFMLCILNVQG